MKAFITVIGKDSVGIIAHIAAGLAKQEVNILDINQTVMEGTFTMVMMVDVSNSRVPFSELTEEMEKTGRELGLSVQIQHEDIFNSMHRL